MNATTTPSRMRSMLLALAALGLSACAAVRVSDAPRDTHVGTGQGGVLADGGLSPASRETLSSFGLDARACRRAAEPCIARLTAHAAQDARALAAMAELHLSSALAAERSAAGRTDALAHYAETARLAYADLFFAGPPHVVQRSAQMRDVYNHATARLVGLLHAITPPASDRRAPLTVPMPGWQVEPGRMDVRLPAGQSRPRELVPAARLRFTGLRSIARREGFGADFVAVADETGAAEGAVHEPRFLAATVLLRFPGATLEEVLTTRTAVVEVYDPYLSESATIGAHTVPLSANFTAPYALWLSRARFSRAADRALFARSSGLSAPRIYLLQPYDPQRRTIVLLHGLHSSPEAWINLANEIMGDATLRRRYQVWQVFYPTNLPIAENRNTIRRALLDALAALDAPADAPASRNLTLIGHSMGGVLARLLVVESGDALWRAFFDRPVDVALRERHAMLAPYLSLAPLPQVDRAIFIAAPHRGAPMARGWLGRAASRAVRLPLDAVRTVAAVANAVQADAPERARNLRTREMDSIEGLSDQDRYLHETARLPVAKGVTCHSIVGRRNPATPLAQSSDGVVPYRSAHLDGASSELIVTSDHQVQDTADAILEIRHILRVSAPDHRKAVP